MSDKSLLFNESIEMGNDRAAVLSILPSISDANEGVKSTESIPNLDLELKELSSLETSEGIPHVNLPSNSSKKDCQQLLQVDESPLAFCCKDFVTSSDQMSLNFEEDSKEQNEAMPAVQSRYFSELHSSRLIMCDDLEDFSIPCCKVQPLPQCLQRINKEIKSIATSLPCEAESSIFVAVNSNNLCMWRALISGSQGTPYEHGLYLFDILLPADYPNSPPVLNFRTTGNGTIRFNPNLYNDGKVCLSIINTWRGETDEKWNPNYSTILQVLVSIQALVMDSEIIQKEPGYGAYASTCSENKAYSTIVRYGNMMFAMHEMLAYPPSEFTQIIRKHFLLKKEEIIISIDQWVNEASKVRKGPSSRDCQNPMLMRKLMTKGLGKVFKESKELVITAFEALSS